MARKPKVQTRVPEDTFRAFEEYRDNHNLTKSDATRRLVEAGLEAEEEADPTGWLLERLARRAVFIPALFAGLVGALLPLPAVLFLQTGATLPAALCLTASLLCMIVGLLVSLASLAAQLAQDRPTASQGVRAEVADD